MFSGGVGTKKLLVSLPTALLTLPNFISEVFEKAPFFKAFIIAEGTQGVSVLTVIIGLFLQLFLLQLAKPRLDIGSDAKKKRKIK